MALLDIINSIASDGSSSQVSDIRDDSGKTIVHFESINSVDESKFSGLVDPLVVYRTKGNIETVSVAPLKAGQEAIAALPFKERAQYFRRYTKPLYTATLPEAKLPANDSVVTQTITDYGTYQDFIATFETPTDMGTTVDEFFNGLFLDLKLSTLTDFTNGFNAGL